MTSGDVIRQISAASSARTAAVNRATTERAAVTWLGLTDRIAAVPES